MAALLKTEINDTPHFGNRVSALSHTDSAALLESKSLAHPKRHNPIHLYVSEILHHSEDLQCSSVLATVHPLSQVSIYFIKYNNSFILVLENYGE